jgi:molybdopterin/thiamine biosynthesis adenylyltransferase
MQTKVGDQDALVQASMSEGSALEFNYVPVGKNSYKVQVVGLDREYPGYIRDISKSNVQLWGEEAQKRVAEATIYAVGVGGVGSHELFTAARMGFRNFVIADSDIIDRGNIQRQVHSDWTTIGRKKVDVMAEILLRISPYNQVTVFDTKIKEDNIDRFLEQREGKGIVFDGIEFYSVNDRRKVTNTALQKRIPVVASGPVGLGSAYSCFMPGGLNFNEYFGVSDQTPYDLMLASFVVGIAPKSKHTRYMSLKGVNLTNRESPSSAASMAFCAGTQTSMAFDVITERRWKKPIPVTYQFDFPTGTHTATSSGAFRKGIRGKLRRARVDLVRKILNGEEINGENIGEVFGNQLRAPKLGRTIGRNVARLVDRVKKNH